MPKGGRFGKYGEHKRIDRLRKAGFKGYSATTSLRSNRHCAWERSLPGLHKQTKLKLRTSKKQDLPFIMNLAKRVFSLLGPYDEILKGWFFHREVNGVIAKQGMESSGFAMLYLPKEVNRSEAIADLIAIAVAPEHHRRGIGHALLEYTESMAKKLGAKKMLLHTAEDNTRAISFFQNHGYTACNRIDRYYPNGQKALMMVKYL